MLVSIDQPYSKIARSRVQSSLLTASVQSEYATEVCLLTPLAFMSCRLFNNYLFFIVLQCIELK